jgi:hypothetical protein
MLNPPSIFSTRYLSDLEGFNRASWEETDTVILKQFGLFRQVSEWFM